MVLLAYVTGAHICTPPADLQVRIDNINRSNGTFWSSSLILGNTDTVTVLENIARTARTDCTNPEPCYSDTPLSMCSDCPWHWLVHHNPRRYPSTILKAQCTCRNCIGADITRRCHKVYTQITVLESVRDVCVDGLYEYRERTIRVPVGCTCAYLRNARRS